MKSFVKSYLINFSIIITLTVISVWFALKDNYDVVVALIQNMRWYWLILILLWGLLYSLVIGKIISLFARRYDQTYKVVHGVLTGLVGSFFSGITPSATGGQFAQAYIFKKQGIKYSDGASILWADFIVYQTTMMGYVTVLFFFRFTHYMDIIGTWFLAIFVGYIINLFVIGILWTMALCPTIYVKISRVLVRILANLRIVKKKEKTLASWTLQVEGFTSEIRNLKHEKSLIAKTVFWNVVRMTIQFALPFFIIKAMGVSIGWPQFIDCLALASFVLMANAFIPIPGASGGTELIFIQLFKILIGGATASSVMILWRFSTYHVIMLVGACVFLYLKKGYAAEKYKNDKEIVEKEMEL